jgi:undecaprenyl diphosphate synthase
MSLGAKLALESIDPSRIPRHVAIVMDGNGRWARQRGLPRTEGHVRGHYVLREIVQAASDFGIKILTVYAFSTENWRRPKEETETLMHLFAEGARQETPDMIKNGVKMMVSGRLSSLPGIARDALMEAMRATAGGDKIILNLAINYGGRAEIVDAASAIARRVAAGKLSPDEIDEELFSQHLYRPEIPDPDLLIRTAGEMRVSNFLLWEIAYSEIHVTPVLWPDFTKEDLARAIIDYQQRVRKFGGVADTQEGL